MKRHIQRDGLALLITMLLMSVLLGISTSLLNVTLKQYQLSGIARSSEIAFHAANAGIECLSYHDLALAVAGVSKFDVPGVAGNTLPEVVSISCISGTCIISDYSSRIFLSQGWRVVSGRHRTCLLGRRAPRLN